MFYFLLHKKQGCRFCSVFFKFDFSALHEQCCIHCMRREGMSGVALNPFCVEVGPSGANFFVPPFPTLVSAGKCQHRILVTVFFMSSTFSIALDLEPRATRKEATGCIVRPHVKKEHTVCESLHVSSCRCFAVNLQLAVAVSCELLHVREV